MVLNRLKLKRTENIEKSKDTTEYAHIGKASDYIDFLCWVYNVKEVRNEEE